MQTLWYHTYYISSQASWEEAIPVCCNPEASLAPAMSRTELLQSRHRDRLLTNSAAEFLETQADVALGPELAQQPPEFVPELDRFVPPDEITKPDYYEESQTKLLQFRQTLEAFQRTLTDRRLGERYDVQVKETYTIQDVLAIAQTIQERHEGAEEVHSCMGKIRKFFRASGRNASTLQRFLEFVPNGDYTSVICGGFTVILGALERLETLRTDMYKALSDIPKIMSRIHRHLAVHFQSARLKHCADMVWVAVFTVLEAIIRELSTKSSKKAFKVLIKGDAHATDVTTSLASLTAAVNEFEAEANICDAQRLGQVDRATQETWSTTRRMESNVQQLSQGRQMWLRPCPHPDLCLIKMYSKTQQASSTQC
ncbi:uncharacterized protein B0I36DRAFT_324332 [Microdochium trichocladiopsis]|uniref:Fungal STAND N-terminal Goodbye domain-containing protein n=1 Tax=Microdochium trichocladiopsis TaxID=1682393 RepID=A0A9P8Y5K8_9PEZI|nr:uncharacterized protein B0I36DRAFT_324332 [Microdochium trichocladiopsis]KAH7031627.1 hypothetical protein B0I36DRAFT_324332 [Microdochium trichocladiopsis]